MSDKDDYIRVLAVRQPWASLIIEGLKDTEVRKRPIKTSYPIPETVAIYASKKMPTIHDRAGCFSTLGRWNHYKEMSETDKLKFDRLNLQGYNPANLGVIVGTVLIDKCKKITASDYESVYYRSYAPAAMINENSFIWHLKNPVKFAEPVMLNKWPSGGHWARIPKNILPGIEKSKMLKAVEEERM